MTDVQLDKIHIRDLQFRCIIGLNPEEREKKQDVFVNITLEADLNVAGQSDCIEDTVDYKAIKQQVFAMGEASDFQLIESLADRIARICLTDRRVERVTVLVQKPGALRFARTVGVEITRNRAWAERKDR